MSSSSISAGRNAAPPASSIRRMAARPRAAYSGIARAPDVCQRRPPGGNPPRRMMFAARGHPDARAAHRVARLRRRRHAVAVAAGAAVGHAMVAQAAVRPPSRRRSSCTGSRERRRVASGSGRAAHCASSLRCSRRGGRRARASATRRGGRRRGSPTRCRPSGRASTSRSSASSTSCRNPRSAARASRSPSSGSKRPTRSCPRDSRSRGTRSSAKDGTIEPPPPLAAGERWRLVVRLKRPHGNVNPHGFDIEAWLLENNLRATGYVRKDERNARLDAFAGRPSDWVERARERVRARILAALPDAKYAGVIVALTIGDQRAIPEPQWRVFNRTGITHLISISGLHVTVFAALAGALAYALARRSVWLTTRVARAQAGGAGRRRRGHGVRAARRLAGAGAANAADARGRRARPVARAARHGVDRLAVGAGDRRRVGSVGGDHARLLAVVRQRRAAAVRARRPPAVAAGGRPAARASGRALRVATRTQMLVTIGLVPMTLALFQQVSLVSPLANALAIPVVTFVVVPLALAGIVLPLDALWQAAQAIFAAMMVPLDGWRSFRARCGSSTRRRRGRWRPRWPAWCGSPPRAACRAARSAPSGSCRCSWCVPPRPDPGTFRMTVLDVGQGLAVVVRDASAHAALRHRPALHRRRRCRQPHHRAVPARRGHSASRR